MGGASTTFLNIEYCNITANDPSNKPSATEIQALTFLRNVFDKDPKAFLVTVTSQSQLNTQYSAPADAYALPYLLNLYAGYGPEIALSYLYVHPALPHGYLYMDARDFEALDIDGYNDRYLAQHLIPLLPIVYENSEVIIYNVSRVVPPLPSSNQVLLLPLNTSASIEPENQLFCYDMLSQGLYNYTTAFDTDNNIMGAATLLLSFDPKEGSIQGPSVENYLRYVDSGGNLIVLNTDGFGSFAKMLFQPSNNSIEPEYINGTPENITLPSGIVVPTLGLINETEKILSNFVTSYGTTSPYITRMNIGKGQLFYVNVEPLTLYINQIASNKSEIYPIIGKLLNGINLKPYEFLPLSASEGSVKEMYLDGVSINTISILFSPNLNLADNGIGEIRINNANGISVFYNITLIQPCNYSQVTIQTPEATIENGQGFYSQLSLNETAKLMFTPNINLTVKSNDEQFEVSNISTISIIINNPIEILARTPTISADSGTFREVLLFKRNKWRKFERQRRCNI